MTALRTVLSVQCYWSEIKMKLKGTLCVKMIKITSLIITTNNYTLFHFPSNFLLQPYGNKKDLDWEIIDFRFKIQFSNLYFNELVSLHCWVQVGFVSPIVYFYVSKHLFHKKIIILWIFSSMYKEVSYRYIACMWKRW